MKKHPGLMNRGEDLFMNLLDKVGEGFAASVDLLVEKNRQLAQLNRLSAIIKTETDVINRAYIALGKQYFKILEGTAEDNDMSQICEVIRFSEERLKKAQARYDYVKVYGVPAASSDTVDMFRPAENEEPEYAVAPEEAEKEDAEEENADITIAVAEDAETVVTKEDAPEEAAQDSSDEAEDDKTVAERAAETVSYIKRKRSRHSLDDTEAANDD